MIIHFLVLLSFLAGFITADNGINLVRGVEIKSKLLSCCFSCALLASKLLAILVLDLLYME